MTGRETNRETNRITPKRILIFVTAVSLIAMWFFGRADQDNRQMVDDAQPDGDVVDLSRPDETEPDEPDEAEAVVPSLEREEQAPSAAAEQTVKGDLTISSSEAVIASTPVVLVKRVDVNRTAAASPDQGGAPLPVSVSGASTSSASTSSASTSSASTSSASTTLESAPLQMDRIVIPAIGLDVPVAELGWLATTDERGQIFSEWDVANNAAGWHKNSAHPGEGGNIVMSGHNNIFGAVFRELDQLDDGDRAYIYSEDRVHTYEIDQVLVVPELFATEAQRTENARWIEQFGDERLTLVSCWPRDDNSHRIIVVGYAVDEN